MQSPVPRLMSQLFESEIFVQIGDRHFEIPRDIFSSPGDSPNFFTLGFAVFFASPSEVFPGLDRKGLLRPPAAEPPSVPSRSGDVFAELLHLLRGYPLHIRNEEHREELLRDCRYFHLRGLEQKLIPHHISFNPMRGRSEIVLRLENIRQSGVRLVAEEGLMQERQMDFEPCRIMYARPFVDETAHDLILEIGNESTILDPETLNAKFVGQTMARMASLARVIASKLNDPQEQAMIDSETADAEKLQTVLSGAGVPIIWDGQAHITVDGVESTFESLIPAALSPRVSDSSLPPTKRKRLDDGRHTSNRPWIVRTGQWRLTVRKSLSGPWKLKFVAVKLDVYRDELRRNQTRSFLN